MFKQPLTLAAKWWTDPACIQIYPCEIIGANLTDPECPGVRVCVCDILVDSLARKNDYPCDLL